MLQVRQELDKTCSIITMPKCIILLILFDFVKSNWKTTAKYTFISWQTIYMQTDRWMYLTGTYHKIPKTDSYRTFSGLQSLLLVYSSGRSERRHCELKWSQNVLLTFPMEVNSPILALRQLNLFNDHFGPKARQTARPTDLFVRLAIHSRIYWMNSFVFAYFFRQSRVRPSVYPSMECYLIIKQLV